MGVGAETGDERCTRCASEPPRTEASSRRVGDPPGAGCRLSNSRSSSPIQSFILGVAGGKIKVKRPEMNHVPAFPRRVRKTESARASGGHLKSTVPGSLCDLKRQKVGKCSLDNKTEKPLNSRCSAGTVLYSHSFTISIQSRSPNFKYMACCFHSI